MGKQPGVCREVAALAPLAAPGALVASLLMPGSSCPPQDTGTGLGALLTQGNGSKASPGLHAHSRLLTSRATARVLPVPEATQVAPMAALGYGKAHLGTGVTSPCQNTQAPAAAANSGDCPQGPLVPGKWHSCHPDPGLTPSPPCSATATGPRCFGGKTNFPGPHRVMEKGSPQHEAE